MVDVAIREEQVTFIVVEQPIIFNVIEEVVQFLMSENILHFDVVEEVVMFPYGTQEIHFDLLEESIAFLVTESVVFGTDSQSALHRSSVVVKAGQPVYFDLVGNLILATGKRVDAIATGNGNPGDKVPVLTQDIVSLPDWTDGTGNKYLSVGDVYYLDQTQSGKLTPDIASITGQYVLRVGTAISATELDVDIEFAIKL